MASATLEHILGSELRGSLAAWSGFGGDSRGDPTAGIQSARSSGGNVLRVTEVTRQRRADSKRSVLRLDSWADLAPNDVVLPFATRHLRLAGTSI